MFAEDEILQDHIRTESHGHSYRPACIQYEFLSC
jgi:hypothetical protein